MKDHWEIAMEITVMGMTFAEPGYGGIWVSYNKLSLLAAHHTQDRVLCEILSAFHIQTIYPVNTPSFFLNTSHSILIICELLNDSLP